ncbi:unnamed protein product [Microthlaspi erraticum]|uniref:ADP-ribosyl cyclase/cyclic ADP-ribose hydrolase n=1 Tax=Microthlaspi erraticum TaxID=1685480 RepID=A0A6D2L2T7_9BRAS|nr:unnamed protein product [Microthlaspi erraticum]
MASSSALTRTWRYRVFTSFHGPDVRKSFLSHLRKQFVCNGISMFDDQGIERSHTIKPELTRAIKESRISIVVLTKNYASSGWCLDELLEILKCKEDKGQIVMTIFYGVDPSDVRKQTGDFGKVFRETCRRKTEEERRRWSQALTVVGNIAGEHLLNWDNEAEMIEKIARDVSDKLNETPSRDFEGMVGLEARLKRMESLLDLDYGGVKMVAIYGPAGIGKSTIARALLSQFSDRFQLTCFVDNLRRSYPSGIGEYGLKLHLQEEFLSKVLNQNGIRIRHLGAVKDRLRDQRVLIILDDVDDLKQLEALANGTMWFGPGSRIVVTTENKELLQQHGINDTYHVGFPSREEALEILCRYAFSQSYPLNGFQKLAERVTELCGKLPLGLRVVASSLRGKNEDDWEKVVRRLETILDHREIEEVVRVGYESLHENEQSLFLHVAVFFNWEDGDLVKAMLADKNLDITYGLKILENKSLIHVTTDGEIFMHKLLQQLATKVVHSEEPWKRRILVDAPEICDVLERAEGTRAVSGISFDMSDVDEVSIGKKAFKRMPNLRFLKVYKSRDDGNDVLHIPEEMEFPRRLRLLQWEAYPSKCLPPTFHPEYLVELKLPNNNLEKLWGGTQPVTNLKKLQLPRSLNLKELPDLSKAANLERLVLRGCKSLVEIPSSIGDLQKIVWLDLGHCKKLQVVPTRFNLAPHGFVDMSGCSQLRNFPDISSNTTALVIADAMLEQVAKSIRLWSSLRTLSIYDDGANIERIPDCIKDLPVLKSLAIYDCPKLASLPELPRSLERLIARSCESLKTVSLAYDSVTVCSFPNCFKLGREAQRVITQVSLGACLPGRKIPEEFDHRAKGNTLTIRTDSRVFRFCIVISPKQQIEDHYPDLLCRMRVNKGCPTDHVLLVYLLSIQTEHLCVYYADLAGVDGDGDFELESEITFEFISCQEIDIIECGVQISTEESESRRRIEFDEPSEEDSQDSELTDGLICDSKEDNDIETSRLRDCWSWLLLCLVWGRRQ